MLTLSKSPEKLQTLVRPLPRKFTPDYCFERLAGLGGCVWLDSSLAHPQCGRYSYMSADPFSRLRVDQRESTALNAIQQLSAKYFQPKLADLPPFQGGWLGWFGYELGTCFERVPLAGANEFCLPLANLGLYDVALSWDHTRDEGWIISQGWPATEPKQRQRRAYRRMRFFWDLLEQEPQAAHNSSANHRLRAARLVEQHATRWSDEWTSNFSAAGYRSAVGKCVDYIHAGDVFQVNLAQRLLRQATCGSSQLYRHLREHNPAPMSGYADFGRVQVISSSPERFVSLQDGVLETRPIKGTRPRLSDPTADTGIGQLLRASEKDRSENVMIVDLLRNDLSRVSQPDSIAVPSLCELERYPFVWHLVSVVQSKLAENCDALDIIRSAFPGGSITGAPKIRAMEIIAELEPSTRGPYCGSLGYISFAGDVDLSILIRTITACDGWWQVPVGGGIVADSSPHLEEQETWHKAEGILRAIDAWNSNAG